MMNTRKLILAAALAAGTFLLLSRAASGGSAPAPRRRFGGTLPVVPWSVQTINWSKPGGAIGNYTGLSQEAAREKAATDYDNQFLSPWTTGYGVRR